MLSRVEVEEEAHLVLQAWMRDNREITGDSSPVPEPYDFMTIPAIDRFINNYIDTNFDWYLDKEVGIEVYTRRGYEL